MNGSKFLWQSAIIAALGGFLFGFDTAVISGAEQSIQSVWSLDGFWHGFTVATALIGTVVGALTAGKPANKFGRKSVLLVIAALYLLSALGSALTHTWELFLIYRFIGGLGVGASSVIAPTYISEISPAHIRGKLVAMFQLNIVLGILIAYASNYIVEITAEQAAWRWMLGVESVPAAIFFGLLFLIPASPRWLVLQGDYTKAEEILGAVGEKDISGQMKSIKDSIHYDDPNHKEALLKAKYSVPIMLAILVAFFNQFTGINAIMYYAPRIFEIAGLDRASSLFQSVSIGVTNFIFTMLALYIIDKAGRKKLLLIGSAGMVVALGIVTFAFLNPQFGGTIVIIGLIGFIALFAVSQGAVIWVYIAEIFPNTVRAQGQTLGSSTHWVLAALISWTFPLFATTPAFTAYAFLFFALITVVQFIVVYRFFPETKGKSLEEIQKEMGL